MDALPLLAVAALAAAFAGSAFFGAFHDFSQWGALLLIVVPLAGAALLLRPVELGRHGVLALAGLALLLAWSALSTLWAPSVDPAWTETNRVALYLATFLLAVLAVRTRRQAAVVMALVTAGGCVIALYLLTRMVGGSGAELVVGFRLGEPVGYVNGEAGFLLVAFWPLVALAERPLAAPLRAAALAGAAVVAELLELTQSRSLILALALSAIALLAFVPGRLTRAWALAVVAAAVAAAMPWLLEVYAQKGELGRTLPTETVVRSAALAILVSALACGAAWGAGGRLAARAGRGMAVTALAVALVGAGLGLAIASGDPLDRIGSGYREFVEQRPEPAGSQRFTGGGGSRHDLWRVAGLQFRDHPLNGVGAGNYASTYYRERRTEAQARQPHSLWMQALGELGLVGLGLLLLFAGAVSAAGLGRPARRAPGAVWIQVAAAGAFLAWLAQASVDWDFALPGLTGTAMLCGAVLVATARSAPLRPAAPRGRTTAQRALTAGGVVVLLAALASTAVQYGADRYRERGASKLASDPAAARSDARRSLRLNPANTAARYLEAAALARANDYRGTRAALARASRREPFNYVPWRLLGDAARRRGDLRRAARAYARAIRLNPRDRELKLLARQLTTDRARGATE